MPQKLRLTSICLIFCFLFLSLAACGDSATPTQSSVASVKKLRVGLITDQNKIDDKGYNQAAWAGLQRAQKELNLEIKYLETATPGQFDKNLQQFVSEKLDIIVTVGPLVGESTYNAAKANPGITFIGIDQFLSPDKQLPNLASVVFEEDKAGFLAGVLAAGMSKQGKVAAVLGPQAIPQLRYFGEGYEAGANYLRANHKNLVPASNLQVTLMYHPGGNNAFTDSVWGLQQAQGLLQNGNDIIFGAAGGTGTSAIELAASQGAYVIGVDIDQYETLPKAAPKLLSSAMKLIGEGLYSLINDIAGGKFKSGNFVSPVALAPFHATESVVPSDLKTVLKTVENGLKDGSIKTGVKK